MLVRDEADVIDLNLAYHLARGVDEVIVTDHRSIDGTRERLKALDDPRIHVLHEDGETIEQATWVTRMARMAHDLGADWVLNDDADEFLWPEAGDLKEALARVPRMCAKLELRRLDFVARPDDPRPFFERMTVRTGTDELGRPLRPKLAHRARAHVVVGPGSHMVRRAGWRTCHRALVTVLHFPRRTLEQYRHKVAIGGATPGYDHKRMAAAHAALLHGRLDARYEQATRAHDGLVHDARLQEFLSEKWEALLSTYGRPH